MIERNLNKSKDVTNFTNENPMVKSQEREC